MKINKDLKKYLEENILTEYYKNENAHQLNHINYVLNRAKLLSKGLKIDEDILFTCVCYHDIAHHVDAKHHESLSAKYMMRDKELKKYFNNEDRVIIKNAIEDHRASSGSKPRNIYGEILSSADRDTDVNSILRRSYEYTKNHNKNMDEDDIIKESYNHIKEKYGKNGYAKVYITDKTYENYLENIDRITSDYDLFYKQMKDSIQKELVCFGDSLTYGSIGISYIEHLKNEFSIKNKGVNGDTTIGMFNRLKKYVSKNKIDNDIFVISIGTNDLLIPFLSKIDLFWKSVMVPRSYLKKCLKNEKDFKKQYQLLVKYILKYTKNIILVGIPYIELKDFPNEEVDKRNRIIKQIAAKYNINFIDTTKLQLDINKNITNTYTWKFKPLVRLADGIVLPFKRSLNDYFCLKRHLSLTMDGVHFNSKIAKRIAEEIKRFIYKD